MEKKTIFVIVFVCVIIGILILTLSLNASKDKSISIGSCSISVDQLPLPCEPLLLKQNEELDYLNAFVLPNSDGLLMFKSGDKINIACPGKDNLIEIDGVKTTVQSESAQCDNGINFKITGKSVALHKISCSSTPRHVARYTNKTCSDNSVKYAEIEIGFEVSERFIKHLVVCYNKELQHSLYSHQILGSTISGGRKNFSNEKFDEGDFYTVKPQTVETLYKQETQIGTVNDILGFKENNPYIIKDKSFLSKGHYSARADFIYGSQRSLTYYYVNAAPQWKNFNSGNWKTMEEKCRKFASDRRLDLDIYTGSHGISKLPSNVDETLKELYLWNGSNPNPVPGIPVPQLYYRVVFDQKTKAGVAFVGVNNPYLLLTKEDLICEDVCDQIKWIGTDLDRKNMNLGYFYCCQIDDLKKTVTAIPDLKAEKLLV